MMSKKSLWWSTLLLAIPACSSAAPENSNEQPVAAKKEPTTEQSPATPAPPAPKKEEEKKTPTLPTCCENKGTCVPENAVPKAQKDYLTQKECAADNVCAPTENLSPTYKPAACTGGPDKQAKGVCLSNCLELPFKQFLDQGTCDAEHTCVPCVNPLTQEPTGAPGC